VFLTRRTLRSLAAVAGDSTGIRGRAHTAQVDALDERAIEEHLDEMVERTGKVDVSFNLISIPHVQGTPLETLRQRTLLKRMTDVAHLAVLTASDRASAVTATAVNLTCGQVVVD
jgi:hypothetical protein